MLTYIQREGRVTTYYLPNYGQMKLPALYGAQACLQKGRFGAGPEDPGNQLSLYQRENQMGGQNGSCPVSNAQNQNISQVIINV